MSKTFEVESIHNYVLSNVLNFCQRKSLNTVASMTLNCSKSFRLRKRTFEVQKAKVLRRSVNVKLSKYVQGLNVLYPMPILIFKHFLQKRKI